MHKNSLSAPGRDNWTERTELTALDTRAKSDKNVIEIANEFLRKDSSVVVYIACLQYTMEKSLERYCSNHSRDWI